MSIAEELVESNPDNAQDLIEDCEKCCIYDYWDDQKYMNIFRFIDGSVLTLQLKDDYIDVNTY